MFFLEIFISFYYTKYKDMIKNNLILRLQILWISPVFPSILTFVIFTIYKIMYDPLILCDEGDSLDQLKENLREEANNSLAISHSILDFLAQVKEIKETSELIPSQRRFNGDHLQWLKSLFVNSLLKSQGIEDSIRKIDPSFISPNRNLNPQVLRILNGNRS